MIEKYRALVKERNDLEDQIYSKVFELAGEIFKKAKKKYGENVSGAMIANCEEYFCKIYFKGEEVSKKLTVEETIEFMKGEEND